jgi:dihydrodipicolinate synthase/N-acetylneuraminate lyase
LSGGPLPPSIARALRQGGVIPAHPLALTAGRRLDERRQRALTRYYLDAGAVGLAIGVHTTQFAIRDPRVGLYRPVLELGRDSISEWTTAPIVRIAGVIGPTRQAVAEARTARDLGYHVGLVSLGGLGGWSTGRLLAHIDRIAEVLPVMGFYLQPAVGGRPLDYDFWRRLAEHDRVVAIKVAPFDRYRTIDVLRAAADSGRGRDLALYTGNDDAIVSDLLTRYRSPTGGTAEFVGGLLGQWAMGTREAVRLTDRCVQARRRGVAPRALLDAGAALTDANGAIFDAARGFRGCIPGIHEVLRRQGLLAGRWCLDDRETISPGQMGDIDRVLARHQFLADDRFVRENLDRWMG